MPGESSRDFLSVSRWPRKVARTWGLSGQRLRAVWGAWAGLFIVLAMATWVRCEAIRDEPWIDEYSTLWVLAASELPWSRRLELSHQNPLYFAALTLFSNGWATPVWVLRIPSLVAGLAAVAFLARWVARRTGSRAAAVAAAGAAALDGNFIFYASEARPYACVQALSCLHLAALLAWASPVGIDRGRSPRGALAAWVLTGSLMFYIHSTSAALMAAEILIAGVVALRARRARPLLGAAALLAAATLLGWSSLASASDDRTLWATFVTLDSFFTMLRPLAFYYGGLVIAVLVIAAAWRRRSTLSGRAATGQPILASAASRESWLIGFVLLLAIFLCTLLIVVAAHACGFPVAHLRYAIAATAIPPVLVGLAVSRLATARGRAAAALAALVVAAAGHAPQIGWQQGTPQRPLRNERWQAIARRIEGTPTWSEPIPVLVFANLIEDSLPPSRRQAYPESYFAAPLLAVTRGPSPRWILRPLHAEAGPPNDVAPSLLPEGTSAFWLVTRGDPPGPPLQSGVATGDRAPWLQRLAGSNRVTLSDETPPESVVRLYRVQIGR